MGFIGEARLEIIMIFWGGEGSRRAGAGLRFAEEWAAEEILDQVGSRLAAGRGLLQGRACTPRRRGQICSRLSASRSFIKSIHLYAYPAGAYFSMKKSRQKSFRAPP